MKMLVTSNMYPSCDDPTYGTFVKIFCDGIEKNGIEVNRIVLRGRSGIGEKLIKYLRFGFDLARGYLVGREDVVYVHYILHLSPFLLPLHLVRRRKLVLNVHGGDILPRNTLHSILLQFAIRLARRADALVVPSDYFRGVALKQLGIDARIVKVWGSSGVDLKNFTPMKSCEGSPATVRLLCVGRLDPRKGCSVLLHALAKLPSITTREFSLTLVGHGSPTERKSCLDLVVKLGLEDRCSYLGACTHEELPMVLRGADIFVFPTLYEESLGLVALEAMACGLPVVGSRIGALPDYIVEGTTGFLFSPGDSDALALALSKAASSLESRGEVMRNACLSMATRYDRESLEEEMACWLRAIA